MKVKYEGKKNGLDKEAIRREAQKRRSELGEVRRKNFSARIFATLRSLPEFMRAGTIMTYLDFRDEVETTPIAQEILRQNKRLIIPYCRRKEIIPCQIHDLQQDLGLSKLGIREPLPHQARPVQPAEIDLVLVPGLAFDYRGSRIGYGAGYYDRFLPLLRKDVPIIALAFSCQLFENLPTESYDYQMTMIITEEGIQIPDQLRHE